MSQLVDEDVVRFIIDQVWESLLRAEALPWFGEEPGEGGVRAQITLTGEWNGVVRLSCDPGTAERIAATMLSVEDDERLATEDVHDAVGEVVNVVGGNVKGALGGATSLGLPQVTAQADADPVPDGAVPASRCVVSWEGAPVVVEIFTHTPHTTEESTS